MPRRPDTPEDVTAFREVVSQWRLAARTEVKRASSLPTSMFQSFDPMLEARLADSVEAMMRCLHRPDLQALAKNASGEHLTRRDESIEPAELAGLVRRIGRAPTAPDIDDGLAGEYLNLLVDACSTGSDEVQDSARQLLRRDFHVEADGGLDRATVELLAHACSLDAGDGPPDPDELEELCHRVAAAALLHSQEAEKRA
ncbi:MAG TPA: hypothetical protein ENI87_03165 [bacterium]|nr:hypothetical protein [bacterium]